EDAAAIIWLSDTALVLAVADGVGGTPAGREASNVTVTTLSQVLTRRAEPSAGLRPAILDAIEEANRAVIDLARGAATTLVGAASRAAPSLPGICGWRCSMRSRRRTGP